MLPIPDDMPDDLVFSEIKTGKRDKTFVGRRERDHHLLSDLDASQERALGQIERVYRYNLEGGGRVRTNSMIRVDGGGKWNFGDDTAELIPTYKIWLKELKGEKIDPSILFEVIIAGKSSNRIEKEYRIGKRKIKERFFKALDIWADIETKRRYV